MDKKTRQNSFGWKGVYLSLRGDILYYVYVYCDRIY